jgi:uncharacterized protein (TIGR02996 family)
MLLRAVFARPADTLARLAYADYLDGRAGRVECPALPARRAEGFGRCGKPCPHCRGESHLSDGQAERAEFVRVQCDLAAANPAVVELVDAMPSHYEWESAEYRAVAALRRRERELLRLSGPAGWWDAVAALPGAYRATGDDREIHTAAGWRYVVERGFVGVWSGTLAHWLGRPCECVWRLGHHARATPLVGCASCGGCGWAVRPGWDCETGGVAAAACRAAPLSRVTFDDRRPDPVEGAGDRVWLRDSRWWGVADAHYVLPDVLFDRLTDGTVDVVDGTDVACRRYPSRPAAVDDLSAAALGLGRDAAAGLPITP